MSILFTVPEVIFPWRTFLNPHTCVILLRSSRGKWFEPFYCEDLLFFIHVQLFADIHFEITRSTRDSSNNAGGVGGGWKCRLSSTVKYTSDPQRFIKSTCLIHFILSKGFVSLTAVFGGWNTLYSHSSWRLRRINPVWFWLRKVLFCRTSSCLATHQPWAVWDIAFYCAEVLQAHTPVIFDA